MWLKSHFQIGSNNDLANKIAEANFHPKAAKQDVIQGFGPPIEPEPVVENNKVEEEEQPGGNLAKPKFMVDPNDPIYKKGDAAQAGELGKAVVVDKTVRIWLFLRNNGSLNLWTQNVLKFSKLRKKWAKNDLNWPKITKNDFKNENIPYRFLIILGQFRSFFTDFWLIFHHFK